MEVSLRQQAQAYVKTVRGGLNRPEKFTTDSLFQLVALALEGFLISWLEERGGAPAHHAFRDLVRAVEKIGPLPADLKTRLLALDRYQKLCEWIPIDPLKPTRDQFPDLIDLCESVDEYTSA